MVKIRLNGGERQGNVAQFEEVSRLPYEGDLMPNTGTNEQLKTIKQIYNFDPEQGKEEYEDNINNYNFYLLTYQDSEGEETERRVCVKKIEAEYEYDDDEEEDDDEDDEYEYDDDEEDDVTKKRTNTMINAC